MVMPCAFYIVQAQHNFNSNIVLACSTYLFWPLTFGIHILLVTRCAGNQPYIDVINNHILSVHSELQIKLLLREMSLANHWAVFFISHKVSFCKWLNCALILIQYALIINTVYYSIFTIILCSTHIVHYFIVEII